MPRPIRVEYPHAFYHIMNRGQNRQNIFRDDRCYTVFLETLSEVNQKFGAIIHAYCLMSNHYHLIMETPLGNLSKIMQHLNSVYVQKYHRLYKTDGTLFRGRYKAILVDADAYLTQLNRYVHRNPFETKKKIVDKLEEYRWSSYRCYMGLDPTYNWLDKKKTLQMLGCENDYEKYESFIIKRDDKFVERFYKSKKKTANIIGDSKFRNIKWGLTP